MTTDHETFAQAWRRWHQARDRALAAPHGFLAVTGLHWLLPDPQTFPDAPGSWSSDGTRVTVDLPDGVEVELDGTPISGRHVFDPIPERDEVELVWGEAVLEVARRGGRDVLRPRHPDHPLRTRFTETPAYDPDPAWVVTGTYLPFDQPRPTTVGAAAEGLEHVYDAPGRLEFQVQGRSLALTAFPGAEDGFMVLFTDLTSGVTTYAANRMLTVGAPAADGTVVLDFNRAVNLPCAYTDLATCPLPPRENRLPIAIEAGEQLPLERR